MEQSPSESQSVHPVLRPLEPQQLPPRHTPLEQKLLEEQVEPSDVPPPEEVPPPPLLAVVHEHLKVLSEQGHVLAHCES